MSEGKRERQDCLREILARNEVHNQTDIVGLLEAEGIQTTQATLSRDLRELGVVKTERGYAVSMTGAALAGRRRALVDALRGVVRAVDRGGTLVVVRTRPGHAAPVARELGDAGLVEVLGVIANDDTVFVATRAASHARDLVRLLARVTP